VYKDPESGREGWYSVPFQADTNMFVVRKDWLAEAGLDLPASIEELVNAAKKMHDPARNRYGWTGSTYRGLETPMVWEVISWSIGGHEYDANNYPTYDDPLAVKAMQHMVELAELTPPGGKSVNWFEATSLYCKGNVGITTPHGSGILVITDPAQSEVPIGVNEILSEGFIVGLGGWHMGISKASSQEEKDLAFLYLMWLNCRETEKERGKLFPRLSCPVHEAAYSDAYRVEACGSTGKEDLEDRLNLLKTCYTREYGNFPEGKKIEDVLATQITAALGKIKTPEEAMKAVQKEVVSILKKGGRI